MDTIDLHGFDLSGARVRIEEGLESARRRGASVVCIIHGQGKHSERFPILKSFVRHWLEESDFAREHVLMFFRGEDGSPYTRPNAGETIVIFKGGTDIRSIDEKILLAEEEREARRHAKGMRADKRRAARRRPRR